MRVKVVDMETLDFDWEEVINDAGLVERVIDGVPNVRCIACQHFFPKRKNHNTPATWVRTCSKPCTAAVTASKNRVAEGEGWRTERTCVACGIKWTPVTYNEQYRKTCGEEKCRLDAQSATFHLRPKAFNANDTERKCSSCKQVKPISEFWKDSGHYSGSKTTCKSCETEKSKVYVEKNLERVRSRAREYYHNHREQQQESARAWKAANPERVLQYRDEWYANNRDYSINKTIRYLKANPHVSDAIRHKRRARMKSVPGSFTGDEWRNVCEQYDNRCLGCGKKTRLTADHIIPVSKPGATNFIENIQPLCKPCNSRKKTKTTDYRPMFAENLIQWETQGIE